MKLFKMEPGLAYLCGLAALILVGVGQGWQLRDELAMAPRLLEQANTSWKDLTAEFRTMREELRTQQEKLEALVSTHQALTDFILAQNPTLRAQWEAEGRLQALDRKLEHGLSDLQRWVVERETEGR